MAEDKSFFKRAAEYLQAPPDRLIVKRGPLDKYEQVQGSIWGHNTSSGYFPQKLIDEGERGGYILIDQVINDLRSKCVSKFGVDYILGQDNLNIYLDYEKINNSTNNKEEILNFLSSNITYNNGIKHSATGDQLQKLVTNDTLLQMLAKGFDPKRSGDLLLILEHGYLPKTTLSAKPFKGTSHGSGYAYDTHVPCLWYGSNIKSTEIEQRLEIIDISSTLSHILRLKEGAETGKVIQGLIGQE